MNKRNLYFLNGSILIFLVGINFWIYLHRNDGYAYKEFLAYNQLYELKNSPRITELIHKNGDSLKILLSQSNKNSSWFIQQSDKEVLVRSINPVIKLKEGKNLYTIFNTSDPGFRAVKLGINYTPENIYKQNNRKRESVTELYYCNLPVGNYKTWYLSDWQHSSKYSLPDEKKLAAKWIAEHTKIQKGDSVIQKIKKISEALLIKLDNCRGIPDDSMDLVSPYRQFQRAVNKKSKVWCGNFSNILPFFLEAEGIVSREVCLEGKVDSVYKAGHSFNEVFVTELNKWVLVDLTSKAILVSLNGTYLNSLDLYNLHRAGSQEIKVCSFENDSLGTCSFEKIKPFYDDFFGTEPAFVFYFNQQYGSDTYSIGKKLKRYFFESPTFATYSGNVNSGNKKFYCKQLAAAVLVLFTCYLILSGILSFIFKKKQP